jgi:O-antigen/teichoic acid export membrane protein
VAIYGVATRQIPLMNFFPQSLLVSVFPLMVGYFSRGATADLNRVWASTQRNLVLYGSTAVAFGLAYAPQLVDVVYGRKYHDAGEIIVWSVVYSALMGLTFPYGNLLIAAHLQVRRFILHCIALPVMVGLAYPLVTHNGAVGLMQALVGSTLALLALYVVSVRSVVQWNPLSCVAVPAPPALSVAAAELLAKVLGWPWPASMVVSGLLLGAALLLTGQVPLPGVIGARLPRLSWSLGS